MSRVVLFGAGATGARVGRQLQTSGAVDRLEIRDPDPGRAGRLATRLGSGIVLGSGRRLDSGVSAIVVASPAGTQVALARRGVQAGIPVVTTSNQTGEVRRLLGLDDHARAEGVPLVVGAGFMPGLTCLLARHGAAEFDEVDEVHVAKVGTGGPACARQHHRALGMTALDWRDGAWTKRRGGSGRELAWFPDPVGGRDCYRAALPDALLLVPHLRGVQRVTARLGATRRDRLTAALPMLRRPHLEGGIGGVRVELRGRVGIERRVTVFGAVERPAVAAGAVAAATLLHVLRGEIQPGACGLAGMDDSVGLLRTLAARGLKPVRFSGMATFV